MRTPSTQHLSDEDLAALGESASRLIYEWVNSSDSVDAVTLKITTLARFGLSAMLRNPHGHRIDVERLFGAHRAIGYLYEATQIALRERGDAKLTLYRGIAQAQYVPGSLESWTSDLAVAVRFDGYDVLREEVRPTRVLAFQGGPFWGGASSLKESEYLVLAEGNHD